MYFGFAHLPMSASLWLSLFPHIHSPSTYKWKEEGKRKKKERNTVNVAEMQNEYSPPHHHQEEEKRKRKKEKASELGDERRCKYPTSRVESSKRYNIFAPCWLFAQRLPSFSVPCDHVFLFRLLREFISFFFVCVCFIYKFLYVSTRRATSHTVTSGGWGGNCKGMCVRGGVWEIKRKSKKKGKRLHHIK
ncbi:hypothetical protein Tb10.70.5370 [Trypanosoma brucei brucei TREU927]|uniref:T. brucei spp.-specific protein n=1 Tax=Trypanosoma brucei brucei (strain 927/4 GUTat10.1) TaxID=185431 RepID=Q38C08_TRYB2|nr:hypothetical protein Tb10.70.5370 [Trypanosoma brucei brucei TREU927]EAN77662.1 hypothetical protein Tb10.70.5370 [Trypanosoma brucei brucei TREU927]